MTSRAWVSALLDPAAPDAVLVCVTISGADLTEPLRLVANGEPITRTIAGTARTFETYAFAFRAPAVDQEQTRPAAIRIDNVDRRIVETLRAVSQPLFLTVEFVLANAPDTVEQTWPSFRLGPQSWDALSVEADLLLPDDMDDAVMRWSFTPTVAPGLFA